MVRPVDRVLKVNIYLLILLQQKVPMVRPVDRVLKAKKSQGSATWLSCSHGQTRG